MSTGMSALRHWSVIPDFSSVIFLAPERMFLPPGSPPPLIEIVSAARSAGILHRRNLPRESLRLRCIPAPVELCVARDESWRAESGSSNESTRYPMILSSRRNIRQKNSPCLLCARAAPPLPRSPACPRLQSQRQKPDRAESRPPNPFGRRHQRLSPPRGAQPFAIFSLLGPPGSRNIPIGSPALRTSTRSVRIPAPARDRLRPVRFPQSPGRHRPAARPTPHRGNLFPA